MTFIFLLLNEHWGDFFKMNFGNTFTRIGFILEEGRLFKVFGIFLIGICAGRHIRNHQLLNNAPFLKRIAIFGLLLGLPMSGLRAYIELMLAPSQLNSFLITLTYALGTVPCALGYAALIALIYRNKPHLLQWIAPAGKMAFTNYILQTVFGIAFFYKLGLGLAGEFGFTVIMLIAMSYFLMEVLFSTIWLKYFKYGPLEWLWRQLTYGKRLQISKSKAL
ncbi:DUF418 domain-containing protein [Sediminibacter sp. Hel_I_10]|uniref:DUF418 domain-containing protein n=1 Tax=Sediminibacter sp. Hel_I_10 TaxID=1392490 RepID=UPI00047998FA|nr:DUF418 domain-containing protein [Sediminibacter sp. Hel_I_10]